MEYQQWYVYILNQWLLIEGECEKVLVGHVDKICVIILLNDGKLASGKVYSLAVCITSMVQYIYIIVNQAHGTVR